MNEDVIDPRIEAEKFNNSLMLPNRSFMVEIIDNGNYTTFYIFAQLKLILGCYFLYDYKALPK